MIERAEPRRSYGPDDWPKVEDPDRALALYLEQCARPMNATKNAIFARLLPADLRGRRVLDYGAGGGWFTVLCAGRGAEVVAVDAEAAALRAGALYARRAGVEARCTFIQATSLPEDAGPFDVVLAKDVIEHVEDDATLLRRFAAVQPPDGLLIVSTQNALSLTFAVEGFYYRVWRGQRDWCGWDPTHVRFYTPRSLARRLRGAGYTPTARRGIYIVPYRILTYLLLFRRWIELPALRYVDLWLGGWFPLNLFGWDIVVAARKTR